MKKHIRDWYLIGVSFIAGVLFIVQCGGAAKSIGETIANALDISFNNESTSLTATNLQDAMAELAASIPFVYDASGSKVGVYLGMDEGGQFLQIWDIAEKVPFFVEPASGQAVHDIKEEDEQLYYESADCTGTPYMLRNGTDDPDGGGAFYPPSVNGNLYWYVFGGTTKSSSDIHSSVEDDSSCSTVSPSALKTLISAGNDTTPVFVEAEVIAEPSYQGPLFIH